MKSLEAESKEFARRCIIKLVRGQTVTIEYSDTFRRVYPNLFNLYNGKTGVIRSFINDAGDSLVELEIFNKARILVERAYIKEAKAGG